MKINSAFNVMKDLIYNQEFVSQTSVIKQVKMEYVGIVLQDTMLTKKVYVLLILLIVQVF